MIKLRRKKEKGRKKGQCQHEADTDRTPSFQLPDKDTNKLQISCFLSSRPMSHFFTLLNFKLNKQKYFFIIK